MSNNGVFRNPAAEFIYIRTYARWLEDLKRREIWPETVDRYVSYISDKLGDKIPPKVLRKIREAVLGFEVMPSMRFMWAAGAPADQDNTTIFNCSFAAIDNIDAFSEALYILMCGTGYGFSVENKYVSKLPTIPDEITLTDRIYVVEDSRVGWADSVKELIHSLYSGQDFITDLNKLRPAGARLKTMGGRSSGPGPLAQLHHFIREVFHQARGRQLTSLECHDILNEIAQIVVVGGVRRSSEVSLSDLEDELMRGAKQGNFPVRRYMANNSAVYYDKPDIVTFMQEWTALIASRAGERGIVNLGSMRLRAPKRRNADLIMGVNPCVEVSMRSQSFCNLTEAVARPEDDIDTMLEKIETAVWAGAIQSCFTHFPYLSKEWKKNCEEERLLGVSITGQMDAPHLFTEEALQAYKSKAIKIAKKASEILGINMPAAITCVKPSGTVSQLVDSSSGLGARFAEFVIRRYRISSNDPLFRMLKAQGLPLSPENGQRKSDYVKAIRMYDAAKDKTEALRQAKSICSIFDPDGWSVDKVNTWIVSFPVKAPKGSITSDKLTAIQQLEWYKKIQVNWCEHNASITVYVGDNEWLEVGDWVYKNWDIVSGIAFLPRESQYDQMPYEKITKAEYEKMAAEFPKIDYSQLPRFELEDMTSGAKSLACAGGACEQ